MATLREFAHQLSERANIVNIIGGYIPLKKAGAANYKGLCPFHKETKPSFMVSVSKQIYHCFGCQAGGNVFNFIMKYDKVEFREAVEILAGKLGVSVPRFTYKPGEQERERYRQLLFDLNHQAQDYFTHQLWSPAGKAALRYLVRRGLREESIKCHQLGFAPPGWDRLRSFFNKKGFTDKSLEDAGLLVRSEDGSLYDRFRNRVIFPIFDARGRCIGFGGRTLEDAEPKYLNSPESPLYRKGEVLYGLNWAKEALAKERCAILVEGYTDLLACREAGCEHVVATLGTALTESQVSLLKKHCGRVLFIYDPDEAGRKAMLRGAELLLASSFEVRVVNLPEGEDPDSFISTHGRAGFHEQLASAVEVVEFLLQCARRQFQLESAQGKVDALELFLPLLQAFPNAILVDDAVRRIAEGLTLKEHLVREYLSGRKEERERMRQELVASQLDRLPCPERALLKLLIDHHDARLRLREQIEIEWLMAPEIREWVKTLLIDDPHCDFTRLLECCREEGEAQLLREIAFWDQLQDTPENCVQQLPARLRIDYERRCTREIERRLQLFGNSSFSPEIQQLLGAVQQSAHRRLDELRRLLSTSNTSGP